MVKVSRDDILILICGWVYAFLMCILFDGTDCIHYCVLHVTLSSIVLVYVINSIGVSVDRGTFSLAGMYLLVLAIYYQLCSVKYIVNPLYSGFISNQDLRLAGSILSGVVVIVATFIWRRFNRRRRNNDDFVDAVNEINLSPVLIWIIAIVCSVLIVAARVYGTAFSSNETMNSQIINTLLCISLMFAVLGLRKKNQYGNNSLFNYTGFSPIIVILIAAVIQAIILGKRNALVVPVFVLLAGCISFRKIINIASLKKIMAIAPLFLAAFSTVFFLSSSRVEIGSSTYVRELTYRFDLSDFAITEAINTTASDYSVDSVLDGIKLAVPGIFSDSDEKAELKSSNQYKYILKKSGLYSEADYNDTVFSMGAEIGGFVGFVFFPILMMLYYEILDRWISKWKKIGGICKLAIIPYFCAAESAWQGFILNTRTYLIILFVGYVILRFFVYNKISMAERKKLK